MPFSDSSSPADKLKRWIPHLLMLGLLVLACALVLRVFAPLFRPFVLGASLAALTSPLFYQPLLKLFCGKKTPSLGLRYTTAVGVMVSLLFALLSPLLAAVASSLGSAQAALDTLTGLFRKDPKVTQKVLAIIHDKSEELAHILPDFGINPDWMTEKASSFLIDTNRFNQVAFDYLFKGSASHLVTGTGDILFQVVLAFIWLVFLYVHGGALVQKLLLFSPLNDERQKDLLKLHHDIVFRLFTDTVSTAIAKGFFLGLFCWFFTGYNPFLLIFSAAFICLIPVVGTTAFWLPPVSFLYSKNQIGSAIILALLCLSADFFISWLNKKLSNRIYDQHAWMGFLLFMSLIGGLLSFGPAGFVVGPMAVVLVVELGSFFIPLYTSAPYSGSELS